ncbi:LLM class flavin-dependent oxidoreductase [Helicobacter sp. 13S00477-4]|uniref:LLM class flavin-dependent oxidoreductase n=1 Tax=Helicobacter sp. 13S00477-4 TaxID=1905759 RepID=UPI000BA63A8B|nr:LLM class flavin-dependent oxidoreductase [Helicobacter sp. 13S00477-4]PAF51631.1 hypothetical protein BKH44_05310 [Helicobacter sp. 13S00477-4]
MTLQKKAYSFLDLVPIVEGSGPQQALKNSMDIAHKAEELGFKRFWFAEHHNMDGIASSATAILIAHIASHTQSIRVGSGGIMLPNHTPLMIAEEFGTLQELYGNRIDLGVGRAKGGDYESSLAIRKERIKSDENFFEELGELQNFLTQDQNSNVKAIPGYGTNVPIYLLGSSLYSAHVAAQKGIPYAFASHFAPRYLLEALRIYRENFIPSKTLKKPYAIVAIPLILASDDEEALFLASSSYQRSLSLLRNQSLKLKPPSAFLEIDWDDNEKKAVLGMLSTMVLGGKERALKELINILNKTQADEFIFTCDVYDQEKRKKSLEILAEIMNF